MERIKLLKILIVRGSTCSRKCKNDTHSNFIVQAINNHCLVWPCKKWIMIEGSTINSLGTTTMGKGYTVKVPLLGRLGFVLLGRYCDG